MFALSALAHGLILAALILLPILWPEDLIENTHTDMIRLLLYDPPPPPPPPLPKGAPEGGRTRPSRAPLLPEPTPPPSESRMEAPVEVLAPLVAPTGLTDERVGSPAGSELGVPEGMEEGVEGGVVGGIPGGVLGGVIGGTGTGPVPVQDYDRPPRLLRPTKPAYPHEAFVKKIEGVVVIEFLIDDTGRVVRARVVQSIPLLDDAALAAVREWVFAPAIKHGRAVATVARAPVSFRIY